MLEQLWIVPGTEYMLYKAESALSPDKSFVMGALYEFIRVLLDHTVPLLFSPVGLNYIYACM